MCESFVAHRPSALNLPPAAVEIATGCLDSLALLLGSDLCRRFTLASKSPSLVMTLVAGTFFARMSWAVITILHELQRPPHAAATPIM
jgi:hypothetical protein